MKIGISGSMQFTEKMLGLRDQLTELGHDVYLTKFASAFIGKTDQEIELIKLDQKDRYDVVKEFWNLMQNGDALLVANYNKNDIANYIGGNAFLEIGFAHVLGQKIFLLNPIPDIPYYKTEIESMKPIIINGDLTKVR